MYSHDWVLEQLAQNDMIDQALELARTDTERIRVYQRAGRDDARDVAREALHSHEVSSIEGNRDTLTVYCGPFTGTHAVCQNGRGEVWASSHATYVHGPTDVRFESECPDPERLQDATRQLVDGPDPGDAPRATYRRTRK